MGSCRRSALPFLVSGPLGLRTAHGLRTTRSPDRRGHACHAMHALHAFARTRIVLPLSFTGGQRTSCSRRIRVLEAVPLSAIPVKRTAAASDLLVLLGGLVWVQDRSSATCLNCWVPLKQTQTGRRQKTYRPSCVVLVTFCVARTLNHRH